jgi:hypothetical protein
MRLTLSKKIFLIIPPVTFLFFFIIFFLSLNFHSQAQVVKIRGDVFKELRSSPDGRTMVIVALTSPVPFPEDFFTRKTKIKTIQNRVLSSLNDSDFRLKSKWENINGFAGEVTESGLAKLSAHPDVALVYPPTEVFATLGQSVPRINADKVHDRTGGLTGTGMIVAVLDTGIDTDHPQLMDDLVAERCTCQNPSSGCSSCCPGGVNSAEDGNGHGTHVSGIITSPSGVAPDAGIVAVKVLSDSGSGCSSGVLEGLDWVLSQVQNKNLDIKVINMSLGGGLFSSTCDSSDPLMAQALNSLKANGVATFAASGNDGLSNRLNSPACMSAAISVGATNDTTDQVASFSNASTVLDMLAPGQVITSSKLGGGTTNMSGTSMATPHAAGVAALMVEANPNLTPDELKIIMKTAGKPILDNRNGRRFPRIDARIAVDSILGCDCDDPNAIIGTDGDDEIDGTPGDDIICGLEGNDTIRGFAGNDCIDGGEGDDLLIGNKGRDVILGGQGNDELRGNLGNDIQKGEGDDDIVKGNKGKDLLDGGPQTDELNGGPGSDTCWDGEINISCEN